MAKAKKEVQKREWDLSKPGLHPALRDLTPTEEELKTALASPSAGLMSVEDKTRAHAAGLVQTYNEALRFYLSADYLEADKAKRVLEHRLALASALSELERFDEAIEVLTGRTGNPYAGCAKTVTRLKAMIETNAVARAIDDEEECQCERPVREVGPKKKPVTLVLNRRQKIGTVKSAKHGKEVAKWRCQFCGHTNATDQIPERQIEIERIKAEQDSIIAELQRTGREITRAEWVRMNKTGWAAYSDEKLLAET